MKYLPIGLIFLSLLFGCSHNSHTKNEQSESLTDSSGFKMEVIQTTVPIVLREFEPANTYPFFNNENWKFVNKEGEVVLNEVYEKCGFFKDGYAWVVKNSKFGVIRQNGTYLFPCEYDGAARIQGGLIPLKRANLWGFYDTTGKQIIPFLYENYNFANDGFIHVVQNRQWGMIDNNGNQICLPLYDYDFKFDNNIAVVYRKRKQGVIDSKGHVLLECNYQDVIPVNDSLFIVKISRGYNDDFFGLAKAGGDVVIPLIYRNLTYIGHEKIIAKGENNAGILTIAGDTLIDFMYKDLQCKNTNLLMAQGYNRCGYISTDNDTIIPFTYTYAEPFDGNYAVVGDGKSKGLINSRNQLVISYKDYTSIEKLSGNLILLKWRNMKEGGYFYTFVDTTGKRYFDIDFDDMQYHDLPDWTGDIQNAMDFGTPVNGFILVGKLGRVGMINLQGKLIIPMNYHFLRPLNEYGYTVGTYWNKKAIVNSTGKQLTEFIYDDIEWDDENKYFYALIKVPEKKHETVRSIKFPAGYISYDGRYYGIRWNGQKQLPTEEEYILKIREIYNNITKSDKKSDYVHRNLPDGLKGSLNEKETRFVVTDPKNNIRYEYYYDDRLDRYGPFFIYIVDKGSGNTFENRYYFVHGKNIRWIDETGKQQPVADALYAPRNVEYSRARQFRADFNNQQYLDDAEVNKKIEAIEAICRQIDSDISEGLYKKGDSDREGMGEWQHATETYLDKDNELIYSNEVQSYEEGGYQTTEYYKDGELLFSESDNNYRELSEEDMEEGWVDSQYSIISYYENGRLIRSVTTGMGVTRIEN